LLQLFSFIQKFYLLAFQKFIRNYCHKVFDANAKPLWLDFTGLSSSSWIYIKYFFKLKCTLRDKISSIAMAYVQTKLDLVKKMFLIVIFVRVFTVSAKLWQKAFL